MIERSAIKKIDGKYILITMVAVIFSWLLHEFSHWLTGELLGNKMNMFLNKSAPVAGYYLKDSDYTIVSAGGPIVTLIEALVVFYLMQKQRRRLLYPFLFTCFYMRLFAAIISLRNPNDEARIGKVIGLETFTLPVIITLILLLLVYKTSKHYKFNFKFNLINLALVILFSSVIILTDQYFKVQLI